MVVWVLAVAFATWASWTYGTLLIAFRLRYQHLVGESELPGLIVHFKQFYCYLVTLVEAGLFNGFKALPIYLADVEKAFASRHELHEAAVFL